MEGSSASTRTILVVEKTRLSSGDLEGAAQLEIAKGPCRFVVLVPLAGGQGDGSVSGSLMWLAAGRPTSRHLVDTAERKARRRLDAEVRRLRALGSPAAGDLVYGPLMQAVGQHVRHGIDAAIVSEPARRLLALGLASRIRRRFKIPVARVEPDSDDWPFEHEPRWIR